MNKYRMLTFSLIISFFCFFIFDFYLSDQKKNELWSVSAPQESIDENYQVPFNLVYHFYHALEKNDWEKVKTLVTSEWWAEMYRSGYRQKWQSIISTDSSIDFVMFLVTSQKIDFEKDWSWVMGKVDWASSKQRMDDEYETIFFVKQKDGWKISSIRINLPVETVDNFYQAINEGQFRRLSLYITASYWRVLKSAEIISSLQNDWEKSRTGVYCVFYLKDFGIEKNRAWVKGDVLWNPLTPRVKETPVTIFLTNLNNSGWRIDKISGHWEIEK